MQNPPIVYSSQLARTITKENIKKLNDINLRYSNKLNLEQYGDGSK